MAGDFNHPNLQWLQDEDSPDSMVANPITANDKRLLKALDRHDLRMVNTIPSHDQVYLDLVMTNEAMQVVTARAESSLLTARSHEAIFITATLTYESSEGDV